MVNLNTNPAARVLGAMQAVSLVGIGLYAITLAAHWFSAVARWLILYIVLGLIALVTGWPIPVEAGALALALAPLAISLLALLCPPLIAPFDGRWWEISTGGRPPSKTSAKHSSTPSTNCNRSIPGCARHDTGSSPKSPDRTPPHTPPRYASIEACWKAPTPPRSSHTSSDTYARPTRTSPAP